MDMDASFVPSSREEVTLQFLNEILEENGTSSPVKSFQWKGPANNGLGCMSTLERLTMRLENGKELSLIFKTLPQKDGMFRDFTITKGFAVRELQMYKDLFPKWRTFLEERNVPEKYWFKIPKCYYAASKGEPENVNSYQQIIILEDLFASGYSLWAEGYEKGLSWTDAKPCFRNIALFHAVGLAYRKVHGISNYKLLFPYLDHQKFFSKEEVTAAFFDGGFTRTIELVEEYALTAEKERKNGVAGVLNLLPIPEGLISHLKKLKINAYDNLQFLEPEEGKIGTVAHHDVHINNFMFKKDEAIFFDFQASRYSTPMKDLSFFLIQNCDDSLLTTGFEVALQYYHDSLHEALGALGVDLVKEYSLQTIREDYKAMAYLSMVHIIAGAKVVFNSDAGDDSKRRFYNKLVQMFNDGLLNFRDFEEGQ